MPGKKKVKAKKADEKEDAAALEATTAAAAGGGSMKERGNKAFAAQDFPEALKCFDAAINADKTNPALYSNRSATHMSLKDYLKALDDAQKAVTLKSDWPKGYFRKGQALEQLLRYPEAYQAYQEGLKVDPADKSLVAAAQELDILLEELKITERELTQAGNPNADVFTSMVHWLREGGALFPKLYLQYYSEDYRGVHCLTKVPADDVVLYVPFKYIMTSEVAKASDIGKKIVSSGVDLRSKHSFLASYLLQEKAKKASFWDPYINILPAKYANMPIFFDEDLLKWLKGSFCLGKIADRIDSLRREYDNIRRAVPEFAEYSHEQFIWARLVVITRIFGLVIQGNKTDGLVPYADMLNHKRPRETKWTFDDDRYGFLITSLKTIQRGEQIFDSYGRKCNSRFFVNYGFALDENEDNEGGDEGKKGKGPSDNEAVLRVELPADDAAYQMKLRFLGGRAFQARREFQIPANYKEKKCKELFSFMRLIHAQDSELMLLSSSDGLKLDDIEPISIRNEIAALTTLKRVAAETLTGYPESLEHDRKLLASGELVMFSNKRNCVVQRHGEKEVLAWLCECADKAIPLLQMAWKDLKRLAAKHNNGASSFDYYVTSVVVVLVKRG
jgi:histone-lysine N-methyltransferase SETD3